MDPDTENNNTHVQISNVQINGSHAIDALTPLVNSELISEIGGSSVLSLIGENNYTTTLLQL